MTIVVGYIPTPEGLAAVDKSISLATQGGEDLLVVNSGRRGKDSSDHVAEPADLDGLHARLDGLAISHEIRQPALAESPAEEILAAAEDVDASLIVIGIRRRTPVGKLLMGSYSQQVLLQAECPVLAVKAPELTRRA